jgi:cobalt-zinc-cadmium efflux system protein
VKQLRMVLFLTFIFMLVEFVGGYYTNSLALMSDSVHMLTDTVALGLSLFAFFLSSLPVSDARTFGFYRMEILAAFLNGIFLVLLSIAIVVGAVQRYRNPEPILAVEMFWISLAGLLFNLLGAWLLTRGDHSHPNMKGALFHVLGDALGSLGAIVAAGLAHFYGWLRADSVVSLLIAVIIVVSAFRLIMDTAHVILEGTPGHLNIDDIRRALAQTPGVKDVHDLHVWSITAGMVSLSVHIVMDETSSHQALLLELKNILKEEFQIEHATIQIESQSLAQQEPAY